MQAPITVMLMRGPNAVLTKPMTRGITAPPDTAIINRPEISFERSGNLASASEKITGNMFPKPNPIMKIDIKATVLSGARKTPRTPVKLFPVFLAQLF